MGGPLLTLVAPFLVAPFLFALGLVRFVVPLPKNWRRTRNREAVEHDPSAVSQRMVRPGS
jgi:hypothetical protein